MSSLSICDLFVTVAKFDNSSHELDHVIHSFLTYRSLQNTYEIKCAITCSPVVKFFDVIYPVLDEAANAEYQKQSIANTIIGVDHMQTINFQVSQRPIISVRNKL